MRTLIVVLAALVMTGCASVPAPPSVSPDGRERQELASEEAAYREWRANEPVLSGRDLRREWLDGKPDLPKDVETWLGWWYQYETRSGSARDWRPRSWSYRYNSTNGLLWGSYSQYAWDPVRSLGYESDLVWSYRDRPGWNPGWIYPTPRFGGGGGYPDHDHGGHERYGSDAFDVMRESNRDFDNRLRESARDFNNVLSGTTDSGR